MQKNDELIVKIQNLGVNGEGVALVDNLPVFVPFALPNEVVKIKILKVLKNMAYGKIEQILQTSPNRVQPKCAVFQKCGGCQLQHLSYNEQLKFKKDLVENNFKKIANISFNVDSCEASSNEYEYRNKLQLPVGVISTQIDGKIVTKNVIGFYATNSHRIVPVTNCNLHGKWQTDLVCIALEFLEKSNNLPYDSTMQTGNIKHLVARYLNNKLMLVIVTKTGKINNQNLLIEMLKKQFENFSLFINLNNKNNNVILGEKFKLIYGDATQKLTSFNISYSISPQSFLQVNTEIQNKIYQCVVDNIDSNTVAINAYSGAGLLSAIISSKAKWTYGIEIVEQATQNANLLAKQNNIQNLTNICGDCDVELPKLVKTLKNEKLTIVLDPPRKGCDQKVLEAIKEVSPDKIIYISCNSATLARDVKLLIGDNNYKIKFIKPFDMFPQTCHVETLIVLEKIN